MPSWIWMRSAHCLIVAASTQDYIFSELKIESNKDNKIAFQVSVPLLLKIFAAAATIEADTMQVRPGSSSQPRPNVTALQRG